MSDQDQIPGASRDHEPSAIGAVRGEAEPQWARTIPTTCVETIGGDPDTALRLSFQIKVF